ncbi:hypothetical protein Goshw_024650 [Gossypium schwendimanii]|uniref:Uncharacterized protein n=1 Tax=Gossypium schwendimanii TaxID=34291 RepID=A0A7J9NCM4_GOSSC|nr:hypothetical protein [Gossypium schwendimanii]MBA0881043.1 hypothetical protein [Gossypium schwendimanii]
MTSRKKNGWQFFRICKRRISSGELYCYFKMRFYIGVGIFTRFLCLEFWELLVIPYC